VNVLYIKCDNGGCTLPVDAIRYGDSPKTRQRLEEQIDNLTDTERCRELISQHCLTAVAMDQTQSGGSVTI
jgi:hypothetical protein